MDKVEQIHKAFKSEISIATTAFYVWKLINNGASENKEVHSQLNDNALSWNIITHSLQNTFFISLGRIFDTDGDSFSVHRMMRMYISKLDQFSKESLRERKLEGAREIIPDWLDEYMESSYVPTEDDLNRFRGEIKKKQKEYEDVYRPIRNKIIAHKDFSLIGKSDDLFGKTNIGKIEEILKFLNQLSEVFFDLIYNGNLRRICDAKFDEESFVKEDIQDMLEKLIKT